jgi:hypothetical protein
VFTTIILFAGWWLVLVLMLMLICCEKKILLNDWLILANKFKRTECEQGDGTTQHTRSIMRARWPVCK